MKNGSGVRGSSRVPRTRPILPGYGNDANVPAPVIDALGDPQCRRRAFVGDVIDNGLEVSCRFRGPANLHLRGEQLCNATAHFLVREELSGVQLLQSLVHLLPKPRVVVKVVFDKSPHVLSGAAAGLFGRSVESCLRFRAEIDFHRF
jgi:hypothetical protein